MNTAIFRILIFSALLGLLFALLCFYPPTPAARGHFVGVSPSWLYILFYACGASLAVWGDKTIGILHPISYRWAYISGGAFLMLLVLFLIFSGRNHTRVGLNTEGLKRPERSGGLSISHVASHSSATGDIETHHLVSYQAESFSTTCNGENSQPLLESFPQNQACAIVAR